MTCNNWKTREKVSTWSWKKGWWWEKGRPPFLSQFLSVLVSCSRFSNFADPTILEPGTGKSYPVLNSRLPITQDLTSQDRNENDSGPRFKDFWKYKKQISPKSKALDCNVLFKTLISSYEKESGINIQPGGEEWLFRELTVLGFIRLLTVPLEGWYNLSFLCCTRRK